MLDFGTEACFWCKKLDATTFRDPKVVKLLNEQFIPVKIDANKHPRLTQALNVASFPTLVLATAEGKVIDRHVGYAEVVQLRGLLGQAPAPVPAKAVAPAMPVAKKPQSQEELDAGLAAVCSPRSPRRSTAEYTAQGLCLTIISLGFQPRRGDRC